MQSTEESMLIAYLPGRLLFCFHPMLLDFLSFPSSVWIHLLGVFGPVLHHVCGADLLMESRFRGVLEAERKRP